MDKILEVNVTKEDINLAKTSFKKYGGYRANNCPVAQAFKRIYPDANIFVTGQVHVGFPNYSFTYVFSQEAADFIDNADIRNDEVEPATLRFWLYDD